METVIDVTIAANGEITAMRLEHPGKYKAADKTGWDAVKETRAQGVAGGVETAFEVADSFVGE